MRWLNNNTRAWRITLAVTLLIILTAPAFPGVSAQSQGVTTRRIWKGATDNICCMVTPRPSPDGRYIPGVDWATGDLAYLDLRADEWVRVTNNGESGNISMSAAFSPDGTRLAHAWFTRADGTWDFRAEDVAGGNVQILIPGDEDLLAWPLDWSPDGRFILVQRSYGRNVTSRADLVLVPAEGGEVRILKGLDPRENQNNLFARFSPDGRWIAYSTRTVGSHLTDIHILSVDGDVEGGLVIGNGDDDLLGWLPDGSGILFHSERDSQQGVWRLPVRNGVSAGDPQLVKGEMWSMTPLGFGPAGYYYSVPTEAPQIHTARLDLERGELASMPVPVRDPSARAASRPAWSPDGRQLAFFVGAGLPGGQTSLTIMSQETGESYTLPFPANVPTVLAWGPDGQSVFFNGAYDGVPGFYRFYLGSGAVETLATVEELGGFGYGFSADGQALIYGTRSSTGEVEVRARNVETGADQLLTMAGPDFSGIDKLPGEDRYLVATHVRDTGEPTLRIWTMDSQGSEVGIIWEGPSSLRGNSRLFPTADGKRVMVYGQDDSDQALLLSFHVETGEVQVILSGTEGDEIGPLRSLTIHPDGSMIAFRKGATKGEIWVMEGIKN
jgi:Tol biopolymer transport system component